VEATGDERQRRHKQQQKEDRRRHDQSGHGRQPVTVRSTIWFIRKPLVRKEHPEVTGGAGLLAALDRPDCRW
jgi:hypothetical protein